MMPTVSAQLLDIAGTLRAHIEEGEFDKCDAFVSVEMATLPAELERIAKQAEQAQGLAA
jgi:hypothetical protein